MCGIAGILDLEGHVVARDEVSSMIRSIQHRGPDDSGVHVGHAIGLANARLAIIDLSDAGHQPMHSDDESLVLVYNGELYNFREIAAELESRGHRFHSRSDTEVVLRAFEEWGPACVERFDGMFAFAMWNASTRTLFIARDRFGVKPLYYAVVGDRLLFASEIKALLEAGLRPSVCEEALVEYFTFQNVYSDLTLFDGVRLLPSGHTLTATVGGGVSTARYWDLELDPDESRAADDWVEEIRAAFERAVTRQLVSDVPLGSYLSGGMDSASIAAVASRTIPRLMTFTGGFDLSSVTGIELVFDERSDAERAASQFRTEHYEMVMHAGDMAWVLPELIWHLEDPRIGMCYQNHYIARLASKFVKVVLAGTGGDELFAGYPWRYDLVADATTNEEFERRYYAYWTRLVSDEDKPDFFEPAVWKRVASYAPRDIFRSVVAPVADADSISKALYFEMQTFLHGLLVVEDKVSMAHSLEARVPFLDNELVDVARRIPGRLKYGDGAGKPLLRRAMAGVLPPNLLEKKKQGFSPPDQSWYAGPTMQYIQQTLLDPRTLGRGWFQERYIRRVLAEHVEGRVNHRLLIWSLLCFEWWNRLFIDGEPAGRHGAWHSDAGATPPRDLPEPAASAGA
jgi:asparagine synthase (glutamine-hydrolysing)